MTNYKIMQIHLGHTYTCTKHACMHVTHLRIHVHACTFNWLGNECIVTVVETHKSSQRCLSAGMRSLQLIILPQFPVRT